MIRRWGFVSLFAVCVLSLATSQVAAQERVWKGGCGDGVVAAGEECDPGILGMYEPNLDGKTCESEGYGAGDLTCTSDCKLDRSLCYCEAGAKFPATGQKRCWDRDGLVIDCAGTGYDGEIQAGAPLSYTDNGDGTITDNNTGLMWEKKDDAGGIHDRYTPHGWERSFSLFIDALNNTCEGDGLVQCDSDDFCGAGGQCGFAGYRDWRMPNIKELQSILDYNRPSPGPMVARVFNTNCFWGCTVQQCSCTVSSNYWSSSSLASTPYYAWLVYFSNGNVDIKRKSRAYFVRAVRGGL